MALAAGSSRLHPSRPSPPSSPPFLALPHPLSPAPSRASVSPAAAVVCSCSGRAIGPKRPHSHTRRNAHAPRRPGAPAAAAAGAGAPEDEAVPPRAALGPEQLAVWEESVAALCSAVEGLEAADAEKQLERAFGWGSQVFWRGRKVREPAPAGQVASALAFLASKGCTGPELAKVTKAFPEALACDVEGQLAVAVKKLEDDWRLKDDVLVRTLARRPQVLGYDVDCEGSCIGDCNRCWARF